MNDATRDWQRLGLLSRNVRSESPFVISLLAADGFKWPLMQAPRFELGTVQESRSIITIYPIWNHGVNGSPDLRLTPHRSNISSTSSEWCAHFRHFDEVEPVRAVSAQIGQCTTKLPSQEIKVAFM